MWGYGVQQRNPNTLLEYIYNESTGALIWTNYGGDGDVDIGRGDIGDVDPTHEGYKVWLFQGMYTIRNVNSGRVMDVAKSERADGTNVQQWVPTGSSCQWWKFEKTA